MKQKIFCIMLVIALTLSLFSNVVSAAYTLPAAFGAPEDFTVQFYGSPDNWDGFTFNVTASKELRSFLDDIAKDGSDYAASGYTLDDIKLQFDFKLDNGNWHYSSDWEDKLAWMPNMSSIRLSSGTYSSFTVIDKGSFEGFVPGEKLPDTKSFFDSHTMDFKVRLIANSQDSSGNDYRCASAWSSVFTYSNKQIDVDPAKLINHAPVLKAVELKKDAEGRPVFHIVTEPAHEDLRLLNSLSGNCMNTEVWIKVQNGNWESSGLDNFREQFDIPADVALSGFTDNYDAAVYEVKVRYAFNLIHSPGKSASSQMIYSPYSNVLSKGHEAYSVASKWATPLLDKADTLGLIPDILKGADMTKPISREEFAELAVRLYEKITGKASDPVSPNPFKDTTNQQILKAFKLGITSGTSETTFSPKTLINREQCAVMLYKVIKAINPDGDYSIAGAKDFLDQKNISGWAVEATKYMSKNGIITGNTKGNFMPKATTTAEKAAGYGMATREQALAMSVSIFEKAK